MLWHNRGHAGWRLGEIKRDRAVFSAGLADLEEAGKRFNALGAAAAVEENAQLLARARAAGAKLGW